MELSENKLLVDTEQPEYESISHSRELILDEIIKDESPIISLLESKLSKFKITTVTTFLSDVSPRPTIESDYQFIYNSYIHFFNDKSMLSDIRIVLNFFIHIRKHIQKSLYIIQQHKITLNTESDIIQLNNIYLWILLNYEEIPEVINIDAIEKYYIESINDNFNYTNIIDIDSFIKIYQYFRQLNININTESIYKYINDKFLYYTNIKLKDKQKYYTTICSGITSMCNCIAGGYTSPCPDSGTCVLGACTVGNHVFSGCNIPETKSNDDFSGFSVYGDATPFLNMLPKCWSTKTKILYFKSVLYRSDFDQLNQTIKYKLSLILLIITKNSKTDIDYIINNTLEKLISDRRFGITISCTKKTQSESIKETQSEVIDPSDRLKKYIKYKNKYINYKNKLKTFKKNDISHNV